MVRETGSTAPGRIGGYRKPLLAGREALLRELAAANGNITPAGIRAGLPPRSGTPCAGSGCHTKTA